MKRLADTIIIAVALLMIGTLAITQNIGGGSPATEAADKTFTGTVDFNGHVRLNGRVHTYGSVYAGSGTGDTVQVDCGRFKVVGTTESWFTSPYTYLGNANADSVIVEGTMKFERASGAEGILCLPETNAGTAYLNRVYISADTLWSWNGSAWKGVALSETDVIP